LHITRVTLHDYEHQNCVNSFVQKNCHYTTVPTMEKNCVKMLTLSMLCIGLDKISWLLRWETKCDIMP